MILRFEGLGYRYPGATTSAVDGVDGGIAPGDRVLLTGPSGCGKSTLLRLAAGLVQRFGRGEVRGTVTVGEADPAQLPPSERVRRVALCAQDPSDQLVTGTVGDEVAFAPESAGWSAEDIAAQVPRLLARLGLDVAVDRSPHTLSGGQQQRLVVAASLAAGAPVLLLDEPLAQLDPRAAQALLDQLKALSDAGVAILLVEHRLEATWPWCDQVWLMDRGRIAARGAPQTLGPDVLRRVGLHPPGLVALEEALVARGHSLGDRGMDPVRGGCPNAPLAPGPDPKPTVRRPSPSGAVLLQAEALSWSWDGVRALNQVSLTVRSGERVAVVGGNGAGKSTLLAALAGDLEAGAVVRGGRVVAVPQDPDLSLFSETVGDELAYGPTEARQTPDAVGSTVARIASALHLEEVLDRSPHALSRGQRLRVAVGAAVACSPQVLLLDEPTAGQDRDRVETLLTLLDALLVDAALVFATHDIGLALRHATRVVVLDGGELVAEGPPASTLGALAPQIPIVLPPVARLCRDLGLPLLSVADLAERWT